MSFRKGPSRHDFWRQVTAENAALLRGLPREAIASEAAFRDYVTSGSIRGIEPHPSLDQLSTDAIEQLWTFINHRACFDLDATTFDAFEAVVRKRRR